MATTVKIGDRDLGVWQRKDRGSLRRAQKLIEAELALKAAKPAEASQRMAELVHAYVGEKNDGVTVDWLLDNLPADCGDVLRACIEATGAEVAAAGEASSPR